MANETGGALHDPAPARRLAAAFGGFGGSGQNGAGGFGELAAGAGCGCE